MAAALYDPVFAVVSRRMGLRRHAWHAKSDLYAAYVLHTFMSCERLEKQGPGWFWTNQGCMLRFQVKPLAVRLLRSSG